MTADGFLNQKQRHPVAMTVAVSINMAAVIALLLAKSDIVVVEPPGGIPTIDLIDPPPPDPIPEPKVRREAKADDTVYVPRPIERTSEVEPADDGIIVEWVVKDTVKADPGPPIQIKRDEAPAPVTVGAEPDGRYAREFQPPYPPQLLRTNVEGKAVVRVLIGADGRVKQVAIISADDPLFADATERQALRKWRFKPATRDGQPVETWKQMTVRFEIRA